MSNRKKYHITQKPNGDWQGKAQGGKRASIIASTKQEAMSKTIEIAKNKTSSQVIIHKSDGKFQEERTYGGKDPFPSRG
jgi:hypothetical protein